MIVARIKRLDDGIYGVKLSRSLPKKEYSGIARLLQEHLNAKRVIACRYLSGKEDSIVLIDCDQEGFRIDSIIK